MKHWIRTSKLGALVCISVVATLGGMRPASACGGFFCSNLTMDQAAEEILFGVDPDAGTVRAIIRIFYQGEAKDFAWVLPLPAVPELSVGSDAIFTALRSRTQPVFNLELDSASQECMWRNVAFPAAEGGDFGEGGDGGGESEPVVQVLSSGQVGSFEYSVVQSEDAGALVEWLNENGFVQPPTSTPLIEHYVAKDMVFVALKLQQDMGAGDITPIVLDFAEQAPCVPLVLTQIAATPDMPVRLWVASKARAVPTNWMEVEPNLKKIDWFNSGSNYDQVARDAIDEAQGRAFITEYAGPPTILQGVFYQEGQYDLSSLAAAADPVTWIGLVKAQFSSSAALLGVLQKVLPLPEPAAAAGVTEQDFYNFEDEYAQYYAMIDFDAEAATQVLDDRLVKPLRDAQELVDRFPYLTRLATIVSPDEMTRDPLFAFNAELADVPVERKALGTLICDDNGIVGATIELAGGATFKPTLPGWWSQSGNVEGDDLSAEPNASEIRLLPTSGQPYVVRPDEVEYVDNQLDTKTADLLIADLTGTGSGGANGDSSASADRGGCSESSGRMPLFLGLLLTAAFWGFRRRS